MDSTTNPPDATGLMSPLLVTFGWEEDLTEWRLQGIAELRQEIPGFTPTTTGAGYNPTNTENSKTRKHFGNTTSGTERSQGYTFKSDTDFVMSRHKTELPILP